MSPDPSVLELKFVAEVVLHSETEAFDGREDIGGRFRPYKGFRVGVVSGDKSADVRLQLARRGMYAPAQLLACQFGEPALHLVDPGGGGRGEVHLIVRPPRQPRLDRSGLVGGIVIHDDVDGEPRGDAGINLLEEGEELPGPMALVALADDEAGGDVERSEQRGRAVPDIGMGTPLGDTGQHRQHRLLAVEGLNLALFVHTEHHRSIRGRQIEPNDVPDLLDEQRVAGEVKRLRAVGLQAEGRPNPANRRVGEATRLGHRAQGPMGRVGRRRAERPLNDLGHRLVRDGPGPAQPRLVPQACEALLHEAAPPLPNGMLMHPEFRGDRLARQPRGAPQNHVAALRQRVRNPVPAHLPLQITPFCLA